MRSRSVRSVLQFLARQHRIGGSIFEHAATFEHINTRDREAVVNFLEQRDVVLDSRKLAENSVERDVSALLTHQNERLNFILPLVARALLGRAGSGRRFLVPVLNGLCLPFVRARLLGGRTFSRTRNARLPHRSLCFFGGLPLF